MPKERQKSEHESRKRRLSSPFRIKVGCVVALRFRSDCNHLLNQASRGFARFEKVFFDGKNKAFNDVWCDPKPGYDRGFNLVGRYIRCCFPRLVLSSSFHVPEASTQFLEGEIVSIVGDEFPTPDSSLSYRQREGRGTTVDLLILKECFKAMPFLLRYRIDSDVDVSQLSESARRHHLNELRIKGSGRAIIRVVLSGTSQSKGDDHLMVRWVVRKRVFIGKLKPPDTDLKEINGIGDTTATSSQVTKRRKIADSNQMYIGDAYDTQLQQRANWRWFASRFNPMLFARTLRIPFEFFGCAISQVVGEVVRIIPQPPDSTSLAMVTVRCLVLPEHTLMGRLSHQKDNEIFQTIREENTETGQSLFDVPIEEILVLNKKIHHLSVVGQDETSRRGLVLTSAYSMHRNEFSNPKNFANQRSFPAQTMNPHNPTGLSSYRANARQSVSEKTGKTSEPTFECCHGLPAPNYQKLVEFAVTAATNSHSIQTSTDEQSRTSTFWGTQELLKHITNLDFSINHGFIPLTRLASPTPNKKKRNNIARRSKLKSSRNKTLSPAAKTIVETPTPLMRSKCIPGVQPAPPVHHTTDTTPKHCTRMFSFNQQTRSFEPGALELQTKFHRDANHPSENVRNSRLLEVVSLTGGIQDDAHHSNRSLRASQRRLHRDFVSIGLNVDTLAGRDYEEHLRFDRSKIHAWGVFSDTEIKQSQMIVEYRGEIIGNSVAEKREMEYNKSNIGSDYMFRIDALTVCDATKQGNVARFINHSCNPNCFTKIICMEGIRRIVIYAKRNIDSGEELCYDYKFPLEYDAQKRIECHCGSRACRGYMNWDSKSASHEKSSPSHLIKS